MATSAGEIHSHASPLYGKEGDSANGSESPTISQVPSNFNRNANTSSNGTARQRSIRMLDEEKGLVPEDLPPSASARSPGLQSQHSTRRKLHDLAAHLHFEDNKEELIKFWDQFTRKGKRKIGVAESIKALALSSWLNILLLLIPLAWVARFLHWDFRAVFTLTFFAIIPLERLFDYGGEQMAFYLGKELGDLIVITLNNAVEATLAIILLIKCELTLLKSTIAGVVILHLLLVPGTAFVTGGARVVQQDLHPQLTQLNHSLLTVGVLAILLPAAFFAGLDTSFVPPGGTAEEYITDEVKGSIVKMSRGLAIFLLVVYICSRIYLHNPPGEENALNLHTNPLAPEELKEKAARLREEDPEVNQWVCIGMIAICIGLMGATAEWLVESIESIQEQSGIKPEWFGLILLPIVSFAADGTVAIVYFVRYTFRHFFHEPTKPTTLAKADAIDLSIQFLLFWMPFFVLLGWWIGKPLTLLFDLFEIAILLGACFLVNYVTADSKTNWAEGMSLVLFYGMIALVSWFYTGQKEVTFLSQCESVAEALVKGVGHGD